MCVRHPRGAACRPWAGRFLAIGGRKKKQQAELEAHKRGAEKIAGGPGPTLFGVLTTLQLVL